MIYSKSLLAFAILLGVVSVVNAECPNACSGHGSCGKYDMCTCYRNFKGNDCSERVCPYDHAFVTTPKGDLNFDGDHYDNTGKLIVDDDTGEPIYASIGQNSDVLTFSSSVSSDAYNSIKLDGDITTYELSVGDKIKIASEVFTITTRSSSGDTFTLDHRRIEAVTDQPVTKFLDTQENPKGDWEMWVGDFSTLGDEGHYYMECSNRGICDGKSGECKCFEGYSGAACQVEACPNDCSGRGTCETVSSLAQLEPIDTNVFVVTGDAGSSSITVNPSCPASLASGGTVVINGKQYAATGCSTKTLSLGSALESNVQGAGISQIMNYQLWDAEQSRACKCDSVYYGIDCSKRKCPVGDDPLTTVGYDSECVDEGSSSNYASYEQRAETQQLTLRPEGTNNPIFGTFRLTFTDNFGGAYTTEPIDVQPLVSVSANTVADSSEVAFNSGSKPSCAMLGIGDEIMVQNSVRAVTSITEDHTTGRCLISKVGVDAAFETLSQANDVDVYRLNAAVEIKNALESLPNSVVRAVSVRPHQIGTGSQYGETASWGDSTAVDGNSDSATDFLSLTVSSTVADSPTTSTLVNVAGHTRLVLGPYDDVSATASSFDGSTGYYYFGPGGDTAGESGKPVLKSGSDYDITFETGCSVDADCQSNGVSVRGGISSTNSDSSATCHPAGYCVCSSATYFGAACTKDGRGSVRRSTVLSNDGDLAALQVDCSDVSSGKIAYTDTASVLPTYFKGVVADNEPRKITFSKIYDNSGSRDSTTASTADLQTAFSVGGQVYLGKEANQVRTIQEITGSYIIVTEDVVDVLPDSTNSYDGRVLGLASHSIYCGASDTYPIIDTASGGFSTSTSNTFISLSGYLREPSTVAIGDRVMLVKDNTSQVRSVDAFTGTGFTRSAISVNEFFTDCAGTASAISGASLFKVGKGTTESLECSRRGLCDEATGTCNCFKGYTGDSCGVQNALAL